MDHSYVAKLPDLAAAYRYHYIIHYTIYNYLLLRNLDWKVS
jgi:hypothetical protein